MLTNKSAPQPATMATPTGGTSNKRQLYPLVAVKLRLTQDGDEYNQQRRNSVRHVGVYMLIERFCCDILLSIGGISC